MLEVGTKAPDFALNDQFGRKITLSQLLGANHVFLAFYPLDFTPT